MAWREIQLTQAIIDDRLKNVRSLFQRCDVKEWISNKVPVNELQNHRLSENLEWTTAMCRACGFSSNCTVQDLVKSGASLFDINSYGDTTLTRTCLHTRDTKEKATFLLREDASLLHAITRAQFTALHNASQTGQIDVCEYLIQQGADINAQNCFGASSALVAAKNNQPAVIELLHRYNANLDLRTKNNNAPLHIAALSDAPEALQTLISFNCDVNASGQMKKNALHYAAQGGSVKCIDELIKCGVKVDVKDAHNQTPLYMAAWNGHVECVNMLIDTYGAGVNSQSHQGWTPLHIATSKGHIDVVQTLVYRKECDITIKEKKGKTACDLATDKRHHEIVKLFSQLELMKPMQQELADVKRELNAIKRRDAATIEMDGACISDDTNIPGMLLTIMNI